MEGVNYAQITYFTYDDSNAGPNFNWINSD